MIFIMVHDGYSINGFYDGGLYNVGPPFTISLSRCCYNFNSTRVYGTQITIVFMGL